MTIGDQPQYLQRQFAHLHLGDNRTRLQTYPENPVNRFTMPSPPPQNNYNSNMPQQGVAGAPNEQALLLLMERTGYSMIQENGQRKYGGPPPAWEGAVPSRGCEIFVGKIPRDCYEDELVPVFEKIGHIYELRLMMDFSGTNRGYCFVTYSHRDEAKRAVKDLNNHEIRKGRYLGVCLSVDNCRLFVGGIPKNKTRDEILQEMVKVTEGVVDVIVYPSATDKTKNRGFAFVEYESHRAAAMARRKLIPGRIQLFGHQIAVDWAEPETDVDEDIMSKVKILYVRNLMLTTTEDYIKDTFQKAAGKDNCVERVKKIRDYAFVHFREREDALRAMNATNNSSLEGSMIEVSLAKPVDKNEYVRSTRGVGRGGSNTAATLQQIYPYGGLDLQGYTTPAATAAYLQYNPTTAAAAAAAAAVAARGIGRGTGRLGMRGRGRGAAGMRGAGGRTYLAGRTGMTYRKQAPEGGRLYDLHPEMVLTPTNPITLKPQSMKSPAQVLEEFCQKNGWGQPIYQLHSTVGRDGSGDVQLFLYKVSIPALASQYPNSTFQPNKLCRSVDEAKQYAAEYVLMQLGVPMESLTSSEALSPLTITSPTTLYQPQSAGRAIAAAPYPTTTTLSIPSVPRTDMTAALVTSVPVMTSPSYVMTHDKMAALPQTHGDLAAYDAAFGHAFSAAAALAPATYATQY